MDTIITLSCIFLAFYMCNGQIIHSTIVFSPSELVSDKMTNRTSSNKLALRYGFHRTSECDNYEKAFICVEKCVDKGYDEAYADKYCFCTCYVKKQKAKYTLKHHFDRTKWKLGAPKTTQPAWIQKLANVAQKMKAESMAVIKKLETQKNDNNAAILDVNSENGTLSEDNAIISDNVTNPSESHNINNDTNGMNNSLIENKATNVTDTLVDSVTKTLSDSQDTANASNKTDIENVQSTADSTDSVNTIIATNDSVTDSVKENEGTTISDIKNETIAQNASAAGT